MAEITRAARASLCSNLPDDQVTGLTAGAALTYFDTVYIKTSDGKVYPTNGTALNAAARYRGVCPGVHAAGDKNVTIYFGDVTVAYAAGLSPGADYYLSNSVAGGLATVATTGGVNPVAFAVDATRVRFLPPLAV